MGILRICILVVVVVVVRTRDLPLSYAGPCRFGGSRSASDASPSFRYGGVGALIKVPTADQTQTLSPHPQIGCSPSQRLFSVFPPPTTVDFFHRRNHFQHKHLPFLTPCSPSRPEDSAADEMAIAPSDPKRAV